MAKKKKKLMYPMYCDKCGKTPNTDKNKSTDNWTVFNLDCECGGRIKIDFDNPYYEE